MGSADDRPYKNTVAVLATIHGKEFAGFAANAPPAPIPGLMSPNALRGCPANGAASRPKWSAPRS